MLPESAEQHYVTMQALTALAVRAARRSWARIDPAYLSESWSREIATLLPAIESVQVRAAFEAGTYSAMTLAQQGEYRAPVMFTDPYAFAGTASDGRALDTLLYRPIVETKSLIGQGLAAQQALTRGRNALDRIMTSQIADIGRQAASVDIVARPGTGYVRMVSVGACSRCSILAGRFYRWNSGFLRHPGCLCEHVATTIGDTAEAIANGLIDDPYEGFKSLSEAEQDRIYTKAGAQAIRDGADMSQVVNARRGMTPNGMFTTEGTTRYGAASRGLRPGQRRLTPEGIYDQANRFGHGREWARERLAEHGYILPAGQVPTGALRGQVEGFGQLGGGGQRRAAREAIEQARATGVRDPRNRYTMTAAERRLYDAQRRYETALSGVSPYTSPGFGSTPDPYGTGLNRGGVTRRPVTPIELAQAEVEYRAWLASGGQIFDR